MNRQQVYLRDLSKIKGSTIAIVYSFEGEQALGFNHYHIWKSDIISGWMNAVQELHCRPFILDVRTFVEKAVSETLPHIDYVLNLNCGNRQLSSMGLVPSTCAFLGIPCIPCNTTAIITGENKNTSNLIAAAMGLQVPRKLRKNEGDGIYRPVNLGSSIGVRRGGDTGETIDQEGLYQEFIHGLDITTPIVYDPLSNAFQLLPTLLYRPHSKDFSWFFGQEEKIHKSGYDRIIIHRVTQDLKAQYLALMQPFSIRTFCRIDARIRCESVEKLEEILTKPLGLEDLYFIEINSMPTVGGDNSFCRCFRSITEEDDIYPCIKLQEAEIGSITPNSFLLACSMFAYVRARC